jgi:NAD+ kinase
MLHTQTLKEDSRVTDFKRIGILGHPLRPHTEAVGNQIALSLQAHGITTWQRTQWDKESVADDVQGSDIVVAIGGDGAMLRAARVCAPYEVPVLGLNMGRLGFLTEIASLDDWDSRLERLLAGDYWIERRMMLKAVINHDREPVVTDIALNEVVISGKNAGSMVQLDTYIDGDWATTYNCDALIISTPTGSTAYALAAGGPILPPELANILIVPTAPHLTMDRPLVLSEGSQVAVRASEDNRHQILVSVDGSQLAYLGEHDIIYVTASDYSSRFIRMRERNYFYRSLLDRLEPRVNRAAPEHMKSLREIEDET